LPIGTVFTAFSGTCQSADCTIVLDARVDPQQAGVGQRVTGERLHQRAGETEGDARQQTGQGARQRLA
jgi:hypothetical protein